MPKKPAYENHAAWRAVAALNLVLIVLQAPFVIVWCGLPVLWTDVWGELIRMSKTLWRGSPGPNKFTVW